jgi:hypothetical protein
MVVARALLLYSAILHLHHYHDSSPVLAEAGVGEVPQRNPFLYYHTMKYGVQPD